MAHACTRYRGPSPPSHPDEQLCLDVSARQKLMLHAPKALLWGAMEAMIAVITYYRVRCAVKCCKVSETLPCPHSCPVPKCTIRPCSCCRRLVAIMRWSILTNARTRIISARCSLMLWR